MSHTPGKLVVAEHTYERCAIRSATPVAQGMPGKIVADVGYSGFEKTDDANARRLVACWNALIDLPQDALDGGWTRAGLEAYGLQMNAQRDELLAALKDLSDGFRTLKDSDFPALAKARAAIAKAEGATP